LSNDHANSDISNGTWIENAYSRVINSRKCRKIRCGAISYQQRENNKKCMRLRITREKKCSTMEDNVARKGEFP